MRGEVSEAAASVRERRERLGLSRRALAERSGIYELTIYNAESGKTRNPHGQTIAALHGAMAEVEKARGFALPTPPAPEPVEPPCIRISVGGVRFEVPVDEKATIDQVIDRVMLNLREGDL